MAKKRKTLPKEIRALLENGDITAAKEQFLRCEPNAVTGKYGSNIFSMSPLPREFAFWAKEQGADINFKDYYGKTPIFHHASTWNGDVQLLIDLVLTWMWQMILALHYCILRQCMGVPMR